MGEGDRVGGGRFPVLIPNHACIFRVVDEGVAIVLVTINGIVAIDLFLADRIFVTPTQ